MTANTAIALAFLAICTLQFSTVDSCSCPPPEYRQRNVGCKGEFIAIVNITGLIVHDMQREYTFDLVEDFTPLLASHRSLRDFDSIFTGIYEEVCGVTLPLNSGYLLKGRLDEVPSIALCQTYAERLTHVPTKAERKSMFDKLYKEIC